MNDLIDRIRAARRIEVPVGSITLIARRPTDIEAIGMRYESLTEAMRDIARFVTDWRGVKASDIVPDGQDKPVPFDADLFREWLEDRPDIGGALVDAVLAAYQVHREEAETAGKP